MASSDSTTVSLPLVWVGAEELPIWFANQFMGQIDDQGEAIITFGQVSPPALLGAPEEQKEQVRLITHVAVKPIAKLAMSTQRLQEFVNVLQVTIANQETARRAVEQRREGEQA